MTTHQVRRCQGWIVGHKRDGMVSGVEQCPRAAEWDGQHCEEHKDQKPEEWLYREG